MNGNPAFSAYAISSTILALHLIFLALWTGKVRGQAKTYVSEEDAHAFKGAKAATEHVDVLRAYRAHMNALENDVPFFVVGLLYAMTGATATGAAAYYYTFVGARVLHSIFSLGGMQPWRTIAFLVGALAVVGMAVHVLRASF
jgi:glutathione S-transferase